MGIDNFTATGILKQFKLALKQEKCFLLFYQEKNNNKIFLLLLYVLFEIIYKIKIFNFYYLLIF